MREGIFLPTWNSREEREKVTVNVMKTSKIYLLEVQSPQVATEVEKEPRGRSLLLFQGERERRSLRKDSMKEQEETEGLRMTMTVVVMRTPGGIEGIAVLESRLHHGGDGLLPETEEGKIDPCLPPVLHLQIQATTAAHEVVVVAAVAVRIVDSRTSLQVLRMELWC
jgi:hypothetical protein